MLNFRAVTDDSAAESGDRRLFMAGYLLSTEMWEEFSDAWGQALRRTPSIQYLKMAEAQNLRGEFRHWAVTQKNKKLNRLAKVIRRFDPASYQFSVSREDFDIIYRPAAPYGLAKPHFLCAFGIVSAVTQILASTKLPDVRVEFIFDRQDGVSTDMELFFDYMKENLPEPQQKVIMGEPSFRDDKEFVSLQAADMLAWHLRREHEDSAYQGTPIMSLLRGEMHYMMQVEPGMLLRWAEHHQAQPQVPKTKAEWRRSLDEARALLATGFKVPHGDWKEIQEARVRHLYEPYKANNSSPSA